MIYKPDCRRPCAARSHDMGLQLRIKMDDQMQGMMMSLAMVTDNVTNDGHLVMGSMRDASTMMTMMREP